MNIERVRRDVAAVEASGEAIRLVRALPGAEDLNGFVVGTSRRWLLLHRLVDLRLDGWLAVRLDTIKRAEPAGPNSLAARALRARGQVPIGLPVDLTSISTVLASMAEAMPLVTLLREAMYPDECVIGRPHRIGKKRVHLRDVDTQAEWEIGLYRLGLADLTCIGAGGHYESALYQLAGEPPPLAPDAPSIKAS